MAAVTFEEEVSRLAARVAARRRCSGRGADALFRLFVGTICVFFAATAPYVVAFRACTGKCTAASVLWEILQYSGLLSMLLMAPATAIFFLRAAGSEVVVKDDVDNRVRWWPLLWWTAVALFIVAMLAQLIGVVLQRHVSYLLCTAALLGMLLLVTFFCIHANVALWRMNPQEPAAVAVACCSSVMCME
ncbi:hypothetical protein VPH35_103354 [Triticum aestivum]